MQLNGPADHIRLVAADHDAIRRGEQQVLPPGRQGDGHFAGDLVPQLAALVEDPALQNGQQVVHRHMLHHGVPDGQHVVIGHVAGGEHAVQGAVLIGHGQNGDPVRLHGLPGPADGGGGGQRGGRIVIQIPDLGADVADELRRLGTEPVQHCLGLVTDLPQPGGAVLPLPQGVFQRCIGHGGHNGVRIRVAVAGNIYLIHVTRTFLMVKFRL